MCLAEQDGGDVWFFLRGPVSMEPRTGYRIRRATSSRHKSQKRDAGLPDRRAECNPRVPLYFMMKLARVIPTELRRVCA